MNMNNIILEEAKKIARQSRIVSREQKIEHLEKAEKILINYLKDHPQDTQAWLLLIKIECNPPFDDYDRIVHYANHILSYDFSNAYALLFLSYADYNMMGNSDENLYSRLCMAHNDNAEIMSMIEIAKARYFETRDPVKYEEALKKSIKYCPKYVENFFLLGNLYIQQGKKTEGNFLIEQGVKNITEAVTPETACNYDPTSIDEFLAEFFAGTIKINVVGG